ncbi:MAG: tRNA pseudouridine(55) synthase TruB [Dermatophilaceae bacterium]
MPNNPDAGPRQPAADGLLLVDKPAGWTSHDVVARARGLCHTRKVGHAGTLDPMATGLLVLGIGRATRLLTYLVGCDKEYTATIRLGQGTITDDADGEVTSAPGAGGIRPDHVEREAARLTGDLQQVPSAVSAIKVKGRRAYHRVRAGEDVELPARPVTVAHFDIRSVHEADAGGTPVLDVDVAVTVSSGTYVRALARDLGAALGTAGHLTALRRTRVGGFHVTAAHRLEQLAALTGDEVPVVHLADAARAVFPVREVDERQAWTLGVGGQLASAEPGRSEPVAAIGPTGTLVALLDEHSPTARSLVVFAPAGS